MGLFKRGKKGKRKSGGDSTDSTPSVPAESVETETSPQRVGVVSGVLSTSAETGESGNSLFGDVVARHFGPADTEAAESTWLVHTRRRSEHFDLLLRLRKDVEGCRTAGCVDHQVRAGGGVRSVQGRRTAAHVGRPAAASGRGGAAW